jgi:hypothetical protein
MSDDLDDAIADEDLINIAEKDFDEGIDNEDLIDLVETDLDDGVADQDLMNLVQQVTSEPCQSEAHTPAFAKLNWGTPKRYQPQHQSSPRFRQASSPTKAVSGQNKTLVPVSSSPSYSRQSVLISPTPSALTSHSPTVSSDSFVPRHLVPFADPPVPSLVADRSPIPGVSAHSRIVTHFRLGSALKHAAAGLKTPRSSQPIVELYARVLRSHRDGHRQLFELADVFHYDRPPYLAAEWVGWQGLPYFEIDGAEFLVEGSAKKLCRAVGRIEKSRVRGWRMCILSIWEAHWDDIEAVKGITCI